MRRKRILFCGLLLSLLLMGAGEKHQEPNQNVVSDNQLVIMFGAALGAAFVGILANGLSQLLSSGANKQILDQVAKSLEPIQKSLSELNTRNNEFDRTLQDFRITLISVNNRQEADRILFKQELTNLGDRLENRIVQVESHNVQVESHNVQIEAKLNKLTEDLTSLRINRRTSNE